MAKGRTRMIGKTGKIRMTETFWFLHILRIIRILQNSWLTQTKRIGFPYSHVPPPLQDLPACVHRPDGREPRAFDYAGPPRGRRVFRRNADGATNSRNQNEG